MKHLQAVEEMEMDQGKLFVGGISWDTNEDRLKEYFGAYGEVIEALIMRDRATGRARGFGFIVFADPSVAERVIKEKHTIDGRTAKKAVPRDDQHLLNRSIPGSPSPGRTKKIFVGGLPSTLTENDFKDYFNQFGAITDVVVMYDHNTQRPRGFGFITFDSEDAVERVLHNTFHELNGKKVEVKRAVPKELSPGPSSSPLPGYNYGGISRTNLLGSFPGLGSVGGYGVGRYSPLASVRAGLSSFGSPMGVNLDNAGFGVATSFSSNLGFGRVMRPYLRNSQGRYSTPIDYSSGGSRGIPSAIESPRNLWGNGVTTASNTPGSNYSYLGNGGFGVFGSLGADWGTSLSSYNGGNTAFGNRDNSYVIGAAGLWRNNGAAATTAAPSFANLSRDHEPYGDLYRSWRSSSPVRVATASFGGYGLADSEVNDESEEYGVGYDVQSRQQFSRGVAA